MPLDAPVTHYTTPELVAETLDLPDPTNPDDTYKFSNISHPTYNQVCRMIASCEDQIDRRLRRSWRPNIVWNYMTSIPRYKNDENSWRSDYFQNGGYTVPLHRDILRWNPDPVYEAGHEGEENHIIYPGDKLELRTYNGTWMDISHMERDAMAFNSQSFSFDYSGGKLFLRTYFLQPMYNALRITYRYGSEDGEVPQGIQRLCSLMAAEQVLNSQFWVIKVGNGGDIGSIKNAMLRVWDDEINALISSYQRSGRVYTMINR